MLGLWRLVGITFAVIAPASSVFLTYGTAYGEAGTGVVLAYILAGTLNVLMMLCYAEVGSRHPEAGGDYALAARVLGRRAGSVYTALFALKGMAIPALVALSTASYFHEFDAHVPAGEAAVIIFILYILLAALDIRASSLVVNVMVGVEVLVFGLFLVAGITHLHQPLQVFWHPVMARRGGLTPVSSGTWIAAGIAALYALNGPQACLYYSEETRVAPRQIGRTILAASLATVGVELVAVSLATLALPAVTPTAGAHTIARMAFGGPGAGWVHLLVVAGITMALFDTGLATTMSYSRIFYAIARDRQFPGRLNDICGYVSRRGVPLGALMCLGIVNMAAVLTATVDFLVGLGGTVLIIIYGGIAIASLADRLRESRTPYPMPAWPLPPLIALAGLGLLVIHVDAVRLAVTLLVVLAGLAWFRMAPRGG